MPRVPMQQLPSVQVSTQGGGLLTPPPDIRPVQNFRPQQGAQFGAATQQLGSALQGIASKLQDELDDARVEDGFNQFVRQSDQIQIDYQNQTGLNAIQGYDGAIQNVGKTADEIAKTLDNEVQRDLFNVRASRRINSLGRAMTAHSAVQTRAYEIKELESSIDSYATMAAQSYDSIGQDGGDYASYSGTALSYAGKLSDKIGYANDSAQQKAFKQKVTGVIHDRTLKNLIKEGDLTKAYEYLEKNYESKEISFEQYTNISKSLVPAMWTQRGKQAANTIYKAAAGVQAGDPTASVDAINLINEAGSVGEYDQRKDNQRISKAWTAIDAESLPISIKMLALEMSTNMPLADAKRMLIESDGDFRKLTKLRSNYFSQQDTETQEAARKRFNVLDKLLIPDRDGIPAQYALNAVVNEIVPQEARSSAIASLKDSRENIKSIQTEQYDTLYSNAQDIAYRRIGGWRDVPDNMRYQIKEADWTKLVKGAPRESDPDTYLFFLDNQNTYTRHDLIQQRHLLSEVDFRKFYNQLQSRSGRGINEPAVTISMRQVNKILKEFDFNELIFSTEDDDKIKKVELLGSIEERFAEQQTELGRKLSFDEKGAIIRQTIKDQVRVDDGFLFFSSDTTGVPAVFLTPEQQEDAYVVVQLPYREPQNIFLREIPAAQRVSIEASLKNHGIEINMRNIAWMWARQKDKNKRQNQ